MKTIESSLAMPLPFIKYASKSFFSFDSLFTCYYSKISALVPSSLSWRRVKISLFALSVRAFGHVLAFMASASDSLLDVGAEYVDTGSVVTCSSSCLAWRQWWRRQGVRPQGCLLSLQNTLQDFFPLKGRYTHTYTYTVRLEYRQPHVPKYYYCDSSFILLRWQ